jgi:hypothetical protein
MIPALVLALALAAGGPETPTVAAPAAAPAAAFNPATLEGITVKGKRCTLNVKGCACRPTDNRCIETVAEAIRLAYPEKYLQMAKHCFKDRIVQMQVGIAVSNDAEGAYDPGYAGSLSEPTGRKAFCDKALADAGAVEATLKARAAKGR